MYFLCLPSGQVRVHSEEAGGQGGIGKPERTPAYRWVRRRLIWGGVGQRDRSDRGVCLGRAACPSDGLEQVLDCQHPGTPRVADLL